MARERTTRFRRTDNKKFTLKTIVRTLRQPLFYLFVALYPSSVLAQQGYNCKSQLSHSSSITTCASRSLDTTPDTPQTSRSSSRR
jgi:hypothetical protein